VAILRFFASTRAVVGADQRPSADFGLPEQVDTSILRRTLVEAYPEARNLFMTCTFLADAERIGDRLISTKDVDTIDVLPPFAGG